LADKTFEITVPLNTREVNYEITWFKKDGSKISTSGVDEHGLLFIDEFPQD
jgi:hypothetical protein